MISKQIQQEVIKLRRRGYYFREIANKLNISVGSSYKYGSRYKLSKSTEKILKERIKKINTKAH
jgi:transposase